MDVSGGNPEANSHVWNFTYDGEDIEMLANDQMGPFTAMEPVVSLVNTGS